MTQTPIPLCVDLDGTLSRSDTLFESLLQTLKRAPLALLQLPVWLLKGRAYLKQQLARLAALDATALPYHEELVAWLREQHAQGRPLVLATAADRRIAEAVARHLGIFGDVIASDGVDNLKSEAKRAQLVSRYGDRGYDYAGNDRADLAVWRSARRAIVVNASRGVSEELGRFAEVERRFAGLPEGALAWLRALRVHQWVKNLLVLLPVLLAHKLDVHSLSLAVLAFLSFSLCASSVYVLNDLLDLDADRRHPRKRLRPFASGALGLSRGMMVSLLLLGAAFMAASELPLRFVLVLGFYYVVTLSYSLWLKRVATIDVMLLAGLYTLRIIAGGVATMTELSFWLLAFSMFIFLSLAIIKRYTELDAMPASEHLVAGRGYLADDLPLLRALGVAAGYGAVLVLALYVNSPQSQAGYSQPKWLWFMCPLMLYWISRAWMLTHRGRMHDDPVVFALRDRISLFVVGLMALTVAAAL